MCGEKYNKLKTNLEAKGYRVFSPDLPGFGKEPLSKPVMTLTDYVVFVKDFLDEKKIKQVILLGHSFGGRIATKFSYLYPVYVEKLIITGSPLIKHPLRGKKRIIALIVKYGKRISDFLPQAYKNYVRKLIYYSIGEWDYYKAGDLQKTFKNIISEDLVSLLPHITTPTLLVWGEKETVVSVTDGEKIGNLIPNATFVVVTNATHKLPYEKANEFSRVVLKFLN